MDDFIALPQRAPRERRAVKRAKVDGEPEALAAAGEGDPAPPAAAAGVESVPAAAPGGTEQQQEQQAGEQQQPPQQHDAPVQQGQSDQPQNQEEQEEEADATPAAAQLDLPAYRSAAVRDHKFEYLDHTADVQLHAWGETLQEAFENVALCMFNYMTPLKGIEVDPALKRQYSAEGHDLQSLLFSFLDELLFAFSTEFFVCKHLRIFEFDRENFRIEAEGEGERFDRSRHACGTEVKAITYSAMQINEKAGDAEVFVIVDI